MLYAIAISLIVLWAIGLMLHIVGGLIHILLVIGLAMLVYRMVWGNRHHTTSHGT